MKKITLFAIFQTLAFTGMVCAQTLSGTWEFGYQNTGSSQSSGLSATGFTVGTARGNTTATTYFAPSATPVTLAVGDVLNLTFNLSLDFQGTDNRDEAFRFGLFNTGNSQTTGNNYSVTGNSDWDGYSIWIRHGSTAAAGQVKLMDRTGTSNIVMGGGAGGANSSLSTQNYTANSFMTGTYNGNSLSITRTAIDEVSISGSIAGYTFNNVMDTTDAVFSFDALHFFGAGTPFGTSPAGSFTVSDLNMAVIPEPGTLALSLVAFLTAFAAKFRKRRS